ncbi:DUF5996 family protein [Allosphingosinicella deserti]|uniref:Ava_C0101 and related proteins n=1 Tax=Allosphingosinicella deserti TaxID=2116704 RepID=A0A2P7QUB3_9SPHN|nr:DUF5996 family protein [Sphingomonas deserti]PSJ41549.1 hypothetical protein C7I55_04350 [Sphingomonas deserti]
MASDWAELSASRDGPTIATLHLISQIVGKVAVALLPWRNHGWHLTLRLHPRGLRTEPLHGGGGTFELGLDLVDHAFIVADARGTQSLPLGPSTIAMFHDRVTHLLAERGHDVIIHGVPNEIDPATPFAADHLPRAYDPGSARRLLQVLLASDRVFRLFRSGFLGKASPVHFFWGSFDLAVTRFSGRPAPRHPGGIPHLPDAVTREAYSHEVSSAGFWPGGAGAAGEPFFYSYAYPAPPGFAKAKVAPAAARFDETLGEFVLDYETLRRAADPEAALLAFLDSTYAAAADLAGWDRNGLDCVPGIPAVPRHVG